MTTEHADVDFAGSGKDRLYLDFFDLREAPFSITPDPEFLYFSNTHQSVIDKTLYGISNRSGFILLTGEVGTGKTTLCRSMLDRLDGKAEMVYIINPSVSGVELFSIILDDLGVETAPGATKKALIDLLNRFALAASEARPVVIIIDDAQTMPIDTLEDLRLLSNLETDKEKLLQVVLVGQPELIGLISRPEMRQLRQRIVIACQLGLLSPPEIDGYIDRRLFVAGNKGQIRFTQKAKKQVAQASGGIPRLINIICDYALTAAYISNSFTIGPRHVKSAEKEIGAANLPSGAPGLERPPRGGTVTVPMRLAVVSIALLLIGILAAAVFYRQTAAVIKHAPTQAQAPVAGEADRARSASAQPSSRSERAAAPVSVPVSPRMAAMPPDGPSPVTIDTLPVASAAATESGADEEELPVAASVAFTEAAANDPPKKAPLPARHDGDDALRRNASFILQFGSYRSPQRTQRAQQHFAATGIETHWNRVDLGDKGIWFRLYTGRFATHGDAAAFKSDQGLDEAMVVHAPWTVLVAAGASVSDVSAMRAALGERQIDVATVQIGEDRYRILSGAFVTYDGALTLAREIAAMGIDAMVVPR